MRCGLLILCLSGGTLGLGQAGPAASLTPFGQAPSPWTAQSRDFGKLPEWRWDPSLSSLRPQTVLLPPPKTATVPLGDASIDPRILRHPAANDLGTQPPGTQVAQNLFPGLKFQPIDGPQCPQQPGAAQAEPLPTTWPKLKVQRIPTDWPRLKMEPVAGLGEAASIAGPHP